MEKHEEYTGPALKPCGDICDHMCDGCAASGRCDERKSIIIPTEKTAGTPLPDMGPGVIKEFEITDEDRQYLRRHTFYGQCQQLREACIDLGGQIAKMLRLREICGWMERMLRRLWDKVWEPGSECGELARWFWVDEIDFGFLMGFAQKINADDMVVDGFTFRKGQLWLIGFSTSKPPGEKIKVVLTFKIHSDKWTTSPKVIVPRWPAWRGYKIVTIKDAEIIEYIEMQGLIDYLTPPQKLK